jgi:hypothetical protein
MSVQTKPTTTNGARRVRVAPGESVRWAAVAGFVFFAALLVYVRARTDVPAASDSRREVFSFVAAHADRLQVGAVALALAMPAALVFLAGLVRLLRSAEGHVSGAVITAFGGGTLAAASSVTTALILGTMATRFADLGAGATRTFWTMFLMSTGATLLGLMLSIGATAVVSARRRLFAAWFTIASAALALLSLAGAFTIGYSSDAIQIVAGAAVLLDSVWILIVSVFMWRRSPLKGGLSSAPR